MQQKKSCKVDGCTSAAGARSGFCRVHYRRFKRRGTTELLREKHGMRRTRLYSIWSNMLYRCRNPHSIRYASYGGRGIHVCGRWAKSFLAFRADMGDPPSSIHQIDRINNDGHYELGNCRWVTPLENRRHRRDTKLTQEKVEQIFILKKRGIPTSEIAQQFGVKPVTIRQILSGRLWAADVAEVVEAAR